MEKKRGAKKWQGWIAAAAALVFLVGGTLLTEDELADSQKPENGAAYSMKLTSSRGGDYGVNSMARSASYDAAPMMADAETAAVEETAEGRQEKIIRSASFTIKTLSFEADLEGVQALTAEMGGRVEYLSTTGDREGGEMRYGNLTLRIPAQRLNEFLAGAEGIGRLTSLQKESRDVTDSYYDVQARLDTQQKKMERLQALLLTAQDVSDLIEIESSIADTQYYIDSYTAQLQNYDGKVEYSTVHVTLREIQVQEAEEISLGQRILGGLQHSIRSAGEFLQDAAVFLVAASPWLAVSGVIVFAVVKIIKHKKKRGK